MQTETQSKALDPDVRDVLQLARDRIADPKHWCQGAYAMQDTRMTGLTGMKIGDAEIGAVTGVVMRTRSSPHAPNAVQWCAIGSVSKEADRKAHLRGRALDALDAIAEREFKLPVSEVNDILGHEATIAMFDKVLANETL